MVWNISGYFPLEDLLSTSGNIETLYRTSYRNLSHLNLGLGESEHS